MSGGNVSHRKRPSFVDAVGDVEERRFCVVEKFKVVVQEHEVLSFSVLNAISCVRGR